jgi:hypothetical protein
VHPNFQNPRKNPSGRKVRTGEEEEEEEKEMPLIVNTTFCLQYLGPT